MKKLLSILLALTLCLGAFVSCGNEENSSSESESNRDSVSQTQSNTESASEIVSEENSVKETEDNREEFVYFDEIEDFTLKAGAPKSGLYNSYEKLLTILEEPLDNFDLSVFDDNYILMINGLLGNAMPSNGFTSIGFQNGGYVLGESPQMIKPGITIQFHYENPKNVDSPGIDVYRDALIIIPRSLIDESFVGENNVTVFMRVL